MCLKISRKSGKRGWENGGGGGVQMAKQQPLVPKSTFWNLVIGNDYFNYH